MGIVTGTTQHRLDLVRTYNDPTNPTNPYLVGTNGCTAITLDTNGNVKTVSYTIDGIDYVTTLTKDISGIGKPVSNRVGILTPNLNSPITKSYSPNRPSSRLDSVYPTTFKYVTQQKQETDYFVFKDEAKMGVVFQPKVLEEVFIERQSITVFETQARLGEIISLEGLEEYNNGFYNVTKLE